jgi:apolipoprotein N-acyltransferase
VGITMDKTRHIYCLVLSFLSPILLFAGWPPNLLVPLLFIGFVPLFFLEKELSSPGKTGVFFLYLYLALLLFNVATTWWVWNASPGGAIAMLLANTLVMTVPFMAYRYTRKVLGTTKALTGFILFWLTFEYIHFRWDLAYPWLTVGNGFAKATALVQWYEYTGALGGTLWVLVTNVILFQMILKTSMFKQVGAIIVLVAPMLWSVYLGGRQSHCKPTNEIVVVQPNIDPYSKFDSKSEYDQVRSFLHLAEGQITPNTELVVLPETAIVEYLDEDHINSFESIRMFTRFLKKHKGLKVITGAATYRFFEDGEKPTYTARSQRSYSKHFDSATSEVVIDTIIRYYDSYNTALLIDTNGVADMYHKSKLVPGTESMPSFFNFLKPLTIDLGGVSGSLGTDSTSHVFVPSTMDSKLRPAALICYESVFGGYVSTFVQKKANILFVITNDGWWGETPGHIHHLHYARLRAIENRRYVVRAANTGISAVIDDNGKILHRTNWWEAVAFRAEVPPLTYETFYMRNGDFLGRIAAFLSLFLLLSVWVKKRTSS